MAGQKFERNSIVLASSAFMLGVVTGLVVNGAARQTLERVRARRWHREHERTVTYDENLPDSLGRREPAPDPGQPRYGGTGALGVHPDAAEAGTPSQRNRP